jgi:uncharacterized paraquat-inducible protein A
MAEPGSMLQVCPTCGISFASDVPRCPECGQRVGGGNRRILMIVIGVVIAVVVVLAALWAANVIPASPPGNF